MNLYTELVEIIGQNWNEDKQRFERYELQRVTANKAARIMRKLGFRNAIAGQSFNGWQDVHATFLGNRIVLGVHLNGSVAFLPPKTPLGPLGREWIKVKQDLSDLPTVIKTSLTTAIERGLKPEGI